MREKAELPDLYQSNDERAFDFVPATGLSNSSEASPYDNMPAELDWTLNLSGGLEVMLSFLEDNKDWTPLNALGKQGMVPTAAPVAIGQVWSKRGIPTLNTCPEPSKEPGDISDITGALETADINKKEPEFEWVGLEVPKVTNAEAWDMMRYYAIHANMLVGHYNAVVNGAGVDIKTIPEDIEQPPVKEKSWVGFINWLHDFEQAAGGREVFVQRVLNPWRQKKDYAQKRRQEVLQSSSVARKKKQAAEIQIAPEGYNSSAAWNPSTRARGTE